MVAKAEGKFRGPVPVRNGWKEFEIANDALEDGRLIDGAKALREGVRKYLLAHCEFDGVTLPESKTAESLLKAYRDAGEECTDWVDQILESCEQIIANQTPTLSLGTSLAAAIGVFAKDFTDCNQRGGDL